MNKEEYLKWLQELEEKGLDQDEIEQVVEDYLQEEEF